MNMHTEALNALVKGVDRYQTYRSEAKELGVEDKMTEVYNLIIKAFKDKFKMSETEAISLVELSKLDFTSYYYKIEAYGEAIMISVIDYDAGNLKSVEKALISLGEEVVVSRDSSEILQADKVILPGVGSFGDAMNNLDRFGLVDTIKKVVDNKTPFLGICLGLQLLFKESEETPGAEGLNILPGKILKIPAAKGIKIPHMGWNSLEVKPGAKLFKGLSDNPYVYFVHSYYLKADDEAIVAASTEYSTHIHASVEKDNVFACQFHPEKSSETGLRILKNFAEL